MIVIGFAGPARAGKTHVTEGLKEQAEAQGWDVHILPFAKPLKDEAQANGFGKEENPEGYRKFCQEEGAARRTENPNYWLDQWYLQLKELTDAEREGGWNPVLVIADDVRYENELAAIRKNNGIVCFLNPGDRVLPEADAEWRTHESEMLANTVLGNMSMHKGMFDYVVNNDKDSVSLDLWSSFFFSHVINFPGDDDQQCKCEGCKASLENREVDPAEIEKQLKDLLDSMEDELDIDDPFND